MQAFIVPFFAALGAGLFHAWWDRFKEREAEKPMRVKFRNGQYVPYSLVAKLQRAGIIACYVWAAYMAVLLVALAAMKLGFWDGF